VILKIDETSPLTIACTKNTKTRITQSQARSLSVDYVKGVPSELRHDKQGDKMRLLFHYYPSHAAQKAQVITQRQSWSVTRVGCPMDSMDQRFIKQDYEECKYLQ